MNPLDHGDEICPNFPHGESQGRVSACQKYFDHRYVIGIHDANKEVIKKFVTSPKNYRMVSYKQFSCNPCGFKVIG